MVMPSHEPTQESRNKVEAMSAIGIPQLDIARVIGINVDTLAKYYREELDTATTKANTQIGGALFKKALSGDTASLIFWMKTRAGWKETNVNEVTGKDGTPFAGIISIVKELDGAGAGLPEIEG